MVDVEHRGLAGLEYDNLAALKGLVEKVTGVGNHRTQSLRVRKEVFRDLIDSDGATVEELHQQVVLLIERTLNLLAQDVLIEEVLHTDADTVNLVGISRADAATGGSDVALSKEALGDLVDRAVVLGDDVR